MSTRLEKLRAALRARGLDAALITSPENRFYFTGLKSSAGLALVTVCDATFFTDFRYAEAAEKVCAKSGFTVKILNRGQNYPSAVSEELSRIGTRSAGFEGETMPYGEYERFKRALSAEVYSLSAELSHIRAVKDAGELALMRRAQEIAEDALAQTLPYIREGVSELDIKAELVYHMLSCGAEDVSFEPIIVSGANSSYPHGSASGKKTAAGDFIILDFGVKYSGYCSDMTRTYAIGRADEEMRRVYKIVLSAQETGLRTARAGVRWSEVDAAARAVIESAGYGEYFGHGLGHSLGLEIHEGLDGGPQYSGLTPPGSVVTVEPGIYLPGRFGVRIEDTVILNPQGCENITRAPKELIIL